MSGNRYPRGKVRVDDEGATTIAVVVQDGTLMLIFGKPISWLGFGIADAEKLIAGMQARVDEIKRSAA